MGLMMMVKLSFQHHKMLVKMNHLPMGSLDEDSDLNDSKSDYPIDTDESQEGSRMSYEVILYQRFISQRQPGTN